VPEQTPATFLASHDCDMLERMYVRCTHCGYDNSPEYRFCGMCGGLLPHPAKETSQPERDVALPPVAAPITPPTRVPPPPSGSGEKIHGPSFLGLSDDQREDFEDPDEDEPKRSRTGLIAAVFLLIAAVGILGWQWRHDGFPFSRLGASSTPVQPASPTAAYTPDASQNPETQAAAKPATNDRGTPAAAPDTGTPTDSSGKAAEGATQGAVAPAPSQDQTAPADKAVSAEATPQVSVPVKPPAKKAQPAHPGTESASVGTAAPAASPDADLELAGEHYLYGTGLPQNCTRAESSLRTAATHGNTKAETVLGTMYATGHCVGRDLPTAYRWFARALHQDPQNSRISADLQVLWRQMTPEEKQLVTTVGH
jgi:hypothetical protein